MKIKLPYLVLSTVLLCQLGHAQQVQKRWEIGGIVGQSGYLGDLNKSDIFSKEPKFALGVLGRYHLNQQLSLRGGLTFGSLSGSDANYSDRVPRGFKTKSPVTDLSAIIEWDFLNKKRFTYDSITHQIKFKKTFSPYFFTGLGVGFTKPTPDFTGTTSTRSEFVQGAAQDRSANYSNTHGVIPVGLGVRYDLNENWVLGVEAGFRFAFSDYLDGISKGANPSRNDKYKLSGITLTYRMDETDSDHDGIPDTKDSCPKEPGSKQLNGCPDRDKDGIADKDDSCPDVYGLASLKGCPDRDLDGIADNSDSCPDVYGLAKFGGCPDKDGDGIADKDDDCPEVAGVVSLKGCPDKDADGVADKNDDCPEVAGVVSLKGCPDKDADGIADKDDDCPEVFGLITLKGCPEQPLKIESVLFETNKATIRPQYMANLDKVAELMAQNQGYQIRIVGHTDNKGNLELNQKLSDSRAKACYDYLLKKSVAAERMSIEGSGLRTPEGDNQTEEGRTMNRRAAIEVVKKQ